MLDADRGALAQADVSASDVNGADLDVEIASCDRTAPRRCTVGNIEYPSRGVVRCFEPIPLRFDHQGGVEHGCPRIEKLGRAAVVAGLLLPLAKGRKGHLAQLRKRLRLVLVENVTSSLVFGATRERQREYRGDKCSAHASNSPGRFPQIPPSECPVRLELALWLLCHMQRFRRMAIGPVPPIAQYLLQPSEIRRSKPPLRLVLAIAVAAARSRCRAWRARLS